ncbi:unnamed protein product [Anisakis simplex]|uniref:BTB domain-containing protein n=1 Tax=Anisakis simplex TaxID=6269 RepID=A0A0M3KC44_ANISI|nr:unnamed protein product [Anisakis simplex]
MLYEQLPYFHAGDVVLQFKGGTTLCADKNLLALHSRYMASLLYEAADGAIIDMGDFEMEAFRELLYQIYATRRPIETDLPRIARAANAYRADIILSKLTAHIRALDVSRLWVTLIKDGFEPKSLGKEIYRHIICPSILKAKSQPYGTPLQPTWNNFNFSIPQPPFTAPFVAENEIWHVNKGIFGIHNQAGYDVGQNGELIARITPKIRAECAKNGVTVPGLVDMILKHVYPSRTIIPGRYFRPMMVFAEEHNLKRLLLSLGEMVCLEPPLTAEQMLEHLQLADRYDLKNLRRACLLRIEGSFKSRASKLMTLPEYKELPEKIREEIEDRHCSGWALQDGHLAG